MYESKLADKKRLTCEVLSVISAVVLLSGMVLYMVSGADGLGTVIISAMFLLTMLATIFVAIGCICRLMTRNHLLTKKRLITVYGFMTYGGLAAGVFALVSVIADLIWRCEAGIFLIAQCVMCVGGLMCFAFGLPIINSFQKKVQNIR